MGRTLAELLNRDEPAWPMILEWISTATNPVEVLSASQADREQTLLAMQVTTRSPMGALAYETGGILVDGGWLRILGAGCDRLQGSLASWNGLGKGPHLRIDPPPGALIVAHDAAGGFFAINGGGLPGPVRNVFYFATDQLEWIDCEMGYSDFVHWCLHGNLEMYYAVERWPGWREALANATGDQGMHRYPPLFTKEGRGPGVSMRWVPMTDLWRMYVYGAE